MATAAAHVWDKQSGLVNPLLLYRWITYDVFAVGFGAHNLFVVGRRGVCVVHGLLGLCGVILLVVWWVLRASYLDKICYGSDGASASDFVHGGSCTDTSSLMGRVHGGGSSPMTLVQHILLWSGVGCVCGCVGVYVRTYVPYMRGLYRDVATNVGAVVDVRRWGELDELRRSAWWTQLLPLTGLVLALPEYALHKHGLFGQRLLFLVVTVGAFIGMMWSLWLNWTWGCYSAFIVSEGNTEILAYGQCTDATSQAYAWTGAGSGRCGDGRGFLLCCFAGVLCIWRGWLCCG